MKMQCCLFLALVLSPPAMAQSIDFGDDNSEYANDFECDDRRFVGNGMATGLDWDDAGHDATDCRHAYELGTIKLWNQSKASAATQCSAISYGDDTSDYARDGTCDDPRFEGPGTDSVMLPDELGRDATDCKKACEMGTAFIRNY